MVILLFLTIRNSNLIMKYFSIVILLFFLVSCSVHQRSNVWSSEEFVVSLNKPTSRGTFIDVGLMNLAFKGVFLGADYLAKLSSKSLTSSYSKTISINDYYNTDLVHVEKTYNQIRIVKYDKPVLEDKKNDIKSIINNDYASISKPRGEGSYLSINEIDRKEKNELLSFDAKIGLISDPKNIGVTRLSFSDLRILFSKTKIYKNENLNAKVTIIIEGQWRDKDGTPKVVTLIDQKFDFKGLKYGLENQIKEPILSPWFYDIPINSDIENQSKFGIVNITVRVDEYGEK